MVNERRPAPRKSIRESELSLAVLCSWASFMTSSSRFSGVSMFEDAGGPRGRSIQPISAATRKMGAWPAKDHRHPTVSASQPPTGPPRLRPVVAARLSPACHVAMSLRGTRSASS